MIHSHENLKGYCSYYDEWDKIPRVVRGQLKDAENEINVNMSSAIADKKNRKWGLYFRLKDIKILVNRGEIALDQLHYEIQLAHNTDFPESKDFQYFKFFKHDKFKETLTDKYLAKLTEQKSKMCMYSYIDYLNCSDYCLEICALNKRPIPFKIDITKDLWQTKDKGILYIDKEIYLDMIKYIKTFKINNEDKRLKNINRLDTILESITV